jgi:hypothetical protein
MRKIFLLFRILNEGIVHFSDFVTRVQICVKGSYILGF